MLRNKLSKLVVQAELTCVSFSLKICLNCRNFQTLQKDEGQNSRTCADKNSFARRRCACVCVRGVCVISIIKITPRELGCTDRYWNTAETLHDTSAGNVSPPRFSHSLPTIRKRANFYTTHRRVELIVNM